MQEDATHVVTTPFVTVVMDMRVVMQVRDMVVPVVLHGVELVHLARPMSMLTIPLPSLACHKEGWMFRSAQMPE